MVENIAKKVARTYRDLTDTYEMQVSGVAPEAYIDAFQWNDAVYTLQQSTRLGT
jgi:hypothetical protein